MTKVEFLEKDSYSHNLFNRLWKSCKGDMFIYKGNLYVVKDNVINLFTDDEIAEHIRIVENVNVLPKEGESKYLSADNLEQCYKYIEKFPMTFAARYRNYKLRKPYN